MPLAALAQATNMPVLVITDEVVLNEELPENEQFLSLYKGVFARYISNRISPSFVPIQQEGLTASSVLQIMPDILKHRPHVAFIALGFSEARQGVDPDLIYNGLEQLIEVLKQNHVYVILAGARAPDTAELAYATRFNNMYSEIANRQQVAFYPDIFMNLRDQRDTFVAGSYVPTQYGINYAVGQLDPFMKQILNALSKRYIN